MEQNSNYYGWGDKALYSVELTPLYWHYQGKRHPEDSGVECYEQGGNTSVPITDIRHTIREIDKHRHVHTMIAESNRKRSQYYQSHNK